MRTAEDAVPVSEIDGIQKGPVGLSVGRKNATVFT